MADQRQPIPEAPLEETDAGKAPAGEGWFVVNVAEARGFRNTKGGIATRFEARAGDFPHFGINARVLDPGQPACAYHAESVQEGFLVLSGECVAIVEGQERTLRAWDYLHCPPWTRHVLVGAGEGPSAVLMVGARHDDKGIEYPVDEAAARYGASVTHPATDPREAYKDWPREFEPTRVPWPLA